MTKPQSWFDVRDLAFDNIDVIALAGAKECVARRGTIALRQRDCGGHEGGWPTKPSPVFP